jgi:hypothetical protein
MKDVQELLAEKENEMARLQKEIQSLQLILPLLAEDAHAAASDPIPETSALVEKKPPENAPLVSAESQATGTDGASTQSPSGLWGFTRRWRSK